MPKTMGKNAWKATADKRFRKRLRALGSKSGTKSMTIKMDVDYQLLWDEGIEATLETYESFTSDMQDQVYKRFSKEKAAFQNRITCLNNDIEKFAKSQQVHPEDVYQHLTRSR